MGLWVCNVIVYIAVVGLECVFVSATVCCDLWALKYNAKLHMCYICMLLLLFAVHTVLLSCYFCVHFVCYVMLCRLVCSCYVMCHVYTYCVLMCC